MQKWNGLRVLRLVSAVISLCLAVAGLMQVLRDQRS